MLTQTLPQSLRSIGLWIGWLLLLATYLSPPLGAECFEPYADQLRLQKAQASQDPYWSHLLTGNIYLEMGCLAEARTRYQAAGRGLSHKTLDKDETFKLENLVVASLQLVDASGAQRRGDLQTAQDQYWEILERYDFAAFKFRIAISLAEIDRQIPLDDPTWEKLKTELETLGRIGFAKALGELALGYLRRGQEERAFQMLQRELANELDFPIRTYLEIELAALLLETDRLAEAQLMMAAMEYDVGSKLLDPMARTRFLELSVQIWKQRVEMGGDRTATERLKIYQAALDTARAAAGS